MPEEKPHAPQPSYEAARADRATTAEGTLERQENTIPMPRFAFQRSSFTRRAT